LEAGIINLQLMAQAVPKTQSTKAVGTICVAFGAALMLIAWLMAPTKAGREFGTTLFMLGGIIVMLGAFLVFG
jgi:hypothetical protein